MARPIASNAAPLKRCGSCIRRNGVYGGVLDRSPRTLSVVGPRLDEVNGIGTDFPVRKASNHRGEYTEVVLRVRSASLVKMVAAGVRHERQTASSMKKINLVDVMKIETAGERDEQVLLHTKSRVWQLLVDGESDQFASTVQRNAKMYLQKHIPVQRVTGEEILIVTNARAESLPGLGASYAVTCCSVVQRLLGTRGVFESVKSNPDFIGILIKALKHPSSVVAFAAANTIRAAIKHYSADSPAPDSPAAARASTTSSFLMQAWPAHA
ncbi:unnamed protein product, partial [Closterium sp. NIES-54]